MTTYAYIPAIAVNDTSGLNLTDSSTISISWTDPDGVFSGGVSYQLEADVRTGGTTSGALVHFTEASMGQNLTTSTPWIAYISCDANETMASEEWDIFTLARDRGAVSALLYSATSQSCLLNPEYITDFEKPLDVFATKTVDVATLIDSQFNHTNATFLTYNGTLLNISGTTVNQSLIGNAPKTKSFLIGTLAAHNSSGQATQTSVPNSSSPSSPSKSKTTSAAMIVLYVITGTITLLFVSMLILGARRARLHPERYGRRDGDASQSGQTTAGGIAQAILDTFPIIKFNQSGSGSLKGSQTRPSQGFTHRPRPSGDMERGTSIALRSLYTDETGSFHSALDHMDERGGYDRASGSGIASGSGSRRLSVVSPTTSRPVSSGDMPLSARGMDEGAQDQCPICLLDFEEGDDLRVLPCEREHVYHQACIDPWLLQVSSSCPLCRKDFNPHAPPPPPPLSPSESPPISPTQVAPTPSGFVKYLHFMRREGRSRRRTRANTHTSGRSGAESTSGLVGSGRQREADQTGPGGY
ncbi:hypothetical protein TREMEDRAFT_33719 [Tremella mesenterica DSM 1558]|uniref:uncharacterized protein n=1 Tax=Tremella mesenterica (strain ATCC 24925 / CBS 8224 / DSM 1558 / NBRC 9311 / NRRL Y-6157 / RJB 2259-6 / UBC 559-6) TaxID=578456 RepID=UPI0003F49854|nr:uncharacterized protein TREMEDRAFT_33719 [Tremella mesenterica DSM 1558]EIW67344.1 hypothetical protein TREMEDRAFT_33719 [Tremella mesenterica DSM 1558]